MGITIFVGRHARLFLKEAAEVAGILKAYVEADLKLQKEGVETLYKAMPALAGDPTTYDLTKAYLLDEEEDQYWDEEQLGLIEKIGYQNWLVKQL